MSKMYFTYDEMKAHHQVAIRELCKQFPQHEQVLTKNTTLYRMITLDKYKIHADTLSEEAKRDQEGHLLRFAISKTAIYFRI